MGANGKNGSKRIRKEKRRAIYERDRWRCVWCLRNLEFAPSEDRTLDHVLPRSSGGTNHASNLLTSCLRCNSQRMDLAALSYAFDVAEGNSNLVAIIMDRVLHAMATPLTKRARA